jgi:hypothetical protein
MHKLVTNADYAIQETNVGQLPQNMGYSNNGGYTMDKKEYYSLLENQNKFAQQTENGIIIHDIADPFATNIKEMSSIIEFTEKSISQLEKIIDNIKKYPCLERCNTIVYYKETCISLGVDNNKQICTTMSIEPTQFTSEKAEEICQKVTNGHGDSPIMGSKLQFSEDCLVSKFKTLEIFVSMKKRYIKNVVCG